MTFSAHDPGFVYFSIAEFRRKRQVAKRLKVGRSIHPKKRQGEIAAFWRGHGLAFGPKLLWSLEVDDMAKWESLFHRLLRKNRVTSEWFSFENWIDLIELHGMCRGIAATSPEVVDLWWYDIPFFNRLTRGGGCMFGDLEAVASNRPLLGKPGPDDYLIAFWGK